MGERVWKHVATMRNVAYHEDCVDAFHFGQIGLYHEVTAIPQDAVEAFQS